MPVSSCASGGRMGARVGQSQSPAVQLVDGQNECRAVEEGLAGVSRVPGVQRVKASVVTAAMVESRYVAELHGRTAVDPPHSQFHHSPEP